MGRYGGPAALADVLQKVMSERGLGSGGTLARLLGLWAGAVGENVARHSSPAMLKGGRLTITVDGSAWMHQLSMLSQTIIEQVNAALGKDEVAELHFRLGKVESPAGKKKEVEAPARIKLTPEMRASIEESVKGIQDAGVREMARKMLAASCRRKK
jgi:predicted nucleic acid-binding Zn ribbon protein